MGLLFWDTVPWVKASGIVDCSSCVVGSYLYVLGQKKAEHDEKCRVRSWLRRYSLIDGFSEDFLLEKTAEYMVYVPKASDGTLFLFHCPETWNSDYRYEVYSCDIKTTEDNSNVIMSPIWVAGRGAGIAPKKRLGASVVTDGRDIYFLAGTIQFPGDATASFIYKFDCERQEWTTVLPIRGSFPSTAPLEPGYRSFRTEQAVICCYNKIFLFGGRVDNSLFSAHRFVLSRFSPVFAQLFATGDRTIKIDNCSARIFHLVLHHFYSRFLLPMRTNGHEEAEQLLKAALRFKIAPLLQLCQEKIELTAKNIESLFRMSKNQSDLDILRQRCRAFVANKPETFEEFIDKSAAGVELHQQPGERTLSQPAQGHFVPPQINPPRTLNFWRLVPPRTEPPKVNLQRRILPPLVQAPVLHRWPKS
eukprot:GEMP01053876.1.p1 GENE.GEMP01053876.1~~GEMP01053876.1.p1  ORF type:complete len:418 (+),score=62.04 GEMP01053876.1:19-1272(+)